MAENPYTHLKIPLVATLKPERPPAPQPFLTPQLRRKSAPVQEPTKFSKTTDQLAVPVSKPEKPPQPGLTRSHSQKVYRYLNSSITKIACLTRGLLLLDHSSLSSPKIKTKMYK